MMKRHFFFSGIGGAGMTPLAELLLARQCQVTGSDEIAGANTEKLRKMGAEILIGHAAANLPEKVDVFVYSSAVPEENPERREAAKRHIPQLRRGEFLAEFAENYRRVAAVSGSHGKSSTSAMLSHILRRANLHPGVMIGAKVYGAPDAENGLGDDIFVCEADESDGTHTRLSPYLGIVPNVDGDHAWSVGGEEKLQENFRTFARKSQHLISGDSPLCRKLFADHPDVRFIPPVAGDFAGFLGFQAIDAQLAVEGAKFFGVKEDFAIQSLADFGGVERRMHIAARQNDVTIVEDYAHHPVEVAASIEWMRKKFPGAHLELIFQPHRYARLERYFDDFVNVLSTADSVIVTDVFAAWSESGARGGKELAEKIPGAIYGGGNFSEIAATAKKNPARPLVIAVIGAGSVNQTLDGLLFS
ncbi:MAG: Mur ligase domain-containing protein [Victivallaceae bacterium]|nr:Mur ligase domain-containing protein [Victivallaceae bacterium]